MVHFDHMYARSCCSLAWPCAVCRSPRYIRSLDSALQMTKKTVSCNHPISVLALLFMLLQPSPGLATKQEYRMLQWQNISNRAGQTDCHG